MSSITLKNNEKVYYNFSDFIKSEWLDSITYLKFHYTGYHNITFRAKSGSFSLQIRIPNSDLVDWKNEKIIYESYLNCFYYKNGAMIRQWYLGQTLEEVKITNLVKSKIIEKVKEFHMKKLNLSKFDWLYYKTEDEKFLKLVEKYKKEPLVTSHCDLAPKNIIWTNKDIKLIDLEWARLAPRQFDAISIMRNFNIDRKWIRKEFNLGERELSEFEYLFDTFNSEAYKKIYNERKALNNRLLGQTNISKKHGKFFIQEKIKNRFNHKIYNATLPDADYFLKVIYEDENTLIRNYEKNYFIELNETVLASIAHALDRMHCLVVKNLPKNTINQQLLYYITKCKNKLKELGIENNFIESMLLISKSMKQNYFVHNDLSLDNIIINKKGKAVFIDMEYASAGCRYFDLGYFIESSRLSEEQVEFFLKRYFKGGYDKKMVLKHRLFANFFGLAWSLKHEDNSEIIEYNLQRIKELTPLVFK